jgi:DNA topoisomerase-1
MPGKKLVIVESPTKAKTIRQFLDKSFVIESSMGHIRDLPESSKDIPEKFKKLKWAKVGVDVEHDFEPLYVVSPKKQKVVKSLKEKLAEADELYLATDEDREGESISWHLLEILKPKVPTHRMVFHEITKTAIQKSLKETRQLNMSLVRAQETRRILDRLVGYTISPLLWKKIAYGLSAGRVQSVAVRLIVEREWERMAFHKSLYWSIKAEWNKQGEVFPGRLLSWQGRKIASSADFDSKTGDLKKDREVLLLDEAQAQKMVHSLAQVPWKVISLEQKPVTRKPQPPFITSTLQQEAARKLGWPSRQTMQVAQRLYEQGFITYMRTDSTFLSDQALQAARSHIRSRFGTEFLPPEPRRYEAKKVKGAQEAHEAIRPAGEEFSTPEETGLRGMELQLYELIYKRTLACQMKDAEQLQTSVRIQGGEAIFSASGLVTQFPGFLQAYIEGSDDPSDSEENEKLPNLHEGESLMLHKLTPLRHETKPPARYTEASLIQTLEKEGIGRPSTYASIMSTIVDRGYVQRQGNSLYPRLTAFLVTQYLKKHLSPYVDIGFTSQMEEALDLIASGELDSLEYLKKFYFDPQNGLLPLVEKEEKQVGKGPAESRGIHFPHLPQYEFRVGRYGPYVTWQEGGQNYSVNLPEDLLVTDVTEDKIRELHEVRQKGHDSLGKDPQTGEPVFLLSGRYGYYVQLGEAKEDDKKFKPKRVSLPPQWTPEQVSFEKALKLLQLPKVLGEHPSTHKPLRVGLGRFGPYVEHDGEFRSIPKDMDFLELDLKQALGLLVQPKGGRGRRKKEVLKVIGEFPQKGGVIEVLNGPYGPYVHWEKVNVSLPKGTDPQTVGLEQAMALIEQKMNQRA